MKRRTRLLIIGGVALVILIGGIVLWLVRDGRNSRAAFKPTTAEATRQSASKASQYCSRKGTALYCQDTVSLTVSKYDLPRDAALATTILPSRDESRYLVIAPANPAYSKPKQRVLIVDASFKTIRQVPEAEVIDAAGFTWAANSRYVMYTRPNGDKNDVYTFDIDTGGVRKVTDQPVTASQPQASADGKTIFMLGGKAGSATDIVAVDSVSGQVRELNSGEITRTIKQQVNATYSPATDRFYINGINDKGKPTLVVARYDNEVLRVTGTLADDDGTVYTPYALSRGGLLALQQTAGKSGYGTISDDGRFTKSGLQPSPAAQFGLSQAPAAAKSADTKPIKADYRYNYPNDVPARLSGFLEPLVTQGCAAQTYSLVTLLSNDADKQASVDITDCTSGVTLRHYYDYRDGNYADVLQSDGIPDCEAVESAGLGKAAVPECFDGGQPIRRSGETRDNQSTGNDDHHLPVEQPITQQDPQQPSSNAASGSQGQVDTGASRP